MNQLKLILISLLFVIATPAFAAPISFGPFKVDTDYAATNVISISDSTFASIPSAITDVGANSERTYINGTSDDAAVTLGFGNIPLLNLAGDDLVLYFLTASPTEAEIDLSINGINKTNLTSRQLFINNADPFTPGANELQYAIDQVPLPGGGEGIFDLSAILVDLDEYNVSLNQTISEITVGLGDRDAFLLYATGNNAPLALTTPVAPVPVPAALILFLSGLTGLGLFNRGRHKA